MGPTGARVAHHVETGATPGRGDAAASGTPGDHVVPDLVRQQFLARCNRGSDGASQPARQETSSPDDPRREVVDATGDMR